MTRHFQDVPEIVAAFFWTVPALSNQVSMLYIALYHILI
jgi:hypothetical protein